MRKKTVISARLPTPSWARWVFRIFITLTTAACFIVLNDPTIDPTSLKRIIAYLKGADMVILGLANMFGVKIEDNDVS